MKWIGNSHDVEANNNNSSEIGNGESRVIALVIADDGWTVRATEDTGAALTTKLSARSKEQR